MRILKLLLTSTIVCLGLTTVLAQTDCPALVKAALETVETACKATERNQLCYGNNALTAIPRENVSDFTFNQPGDRIHVASIQTLQLSRGDDSWGVALMNIQANLPASVPEQNVTLLPFGDVELDNIGDAVQIAVSIAAPNEINVRSSPSSRASLVTTLDPGTLVTANGRSEAGNWIRVQLDDGEQGWVAAFLLQQDVDLSALSIVDGDTPGYAPMQAFNLRTGIADAGCAEAPNSGLLIQIPENAGVVTLQVNGVDIQLGSTTFLQAEAGNAMLINILEGMGTVSVLDKSMLVPAGAATSVTLDENLAPSAPPTRPAPYTLDDLQALPVSLLPRPIEIIEPLIQREINRLTGCQITSTVEGTNFREGPATAYFAHGTLIVDHPYRVTGQTVGRDGFVWWRADMRWVRSDLVTLTGNCDDVTVVTIRPGSPSTSGFSTNLTCTSERVIYAKVGDTIPIVDTYASSIVPVTAINATILVGGNTVFSGGGTISGGGLTWTASWVATAGIHNVEIVYTAVIEVKPDWAEQSFKPGDTWSRGVCQIRVE